MAKIVENKKGFKVIECSLEECMNWGGLGVCDDCGRKADNGYYVAVLNSWLCEECYDKFTERAVRYIEDIAIETRHFDTYKEILGL